MVVDVVEGKIDWQVCCKVKIFLLKLNKNEVMMSFFIVQVFVVVKVGKYYFVFYMMVEIVKNVFVLDCVGVLVLENQGFVKLVKIDVVKV